MLKFKDIKINNSISRSAISVIIVLIITKFFGLIKQTIIAAFFGIGFEMDSYLLVSDFIEEVGVVLFSSLSISFLNHYNFFSNISQKEKNQFAIEILTTFVPLSCVVIVIVLSCSEPISFLLAPGFSENERDYVKRILILLSITIINKCLSSYFTTILEAEKDFIPGKLSGILQSCCIISGILLFADRLDVYSLIYSYIIYNILQNIYLFIKSLKYINYHLDFRIKHKKIVKLIIKQSIPLFLSNAVIQLNALIDKSIASGLNKGNISSLSYGYFIFSSVHSILIGGVCAIVFSHFSSLIVQKKYKKVYDLYKNTINILILILLPFSLFLYIDSELIVRILYGRGAFDETAIYLTSKTMAAYSIGLLFVGIRDVIIRLNYAYQDMYIPTVNGIMSVTVNIILNIIFLRLWGIAGIALASSLSCCICLVPLLILTAKRLPVNPFMAFEKELYIMHFPAIIISIIVIHTWSECSGDIPLLLKCTLDAFFWFCSYYIILLIFKNKYVKNIIKRILRV